MVLRFLAVALCVLVTVPAAADPALERAKAVLAKGILFDGHNDLPWAIRQSKDAPGDVDAYDIRTKAPGDGQTDIGWMQIERVDHAVPVLRDLREPGGGQFVHAVGAMNDPCTLRAQPPECSREQFRVLRPRYAHQLTFRTGWVRQRTK